MKTLLLSVLSVLSLTSCSTKIGITDVSGQRDCSALPITGTISTQGKIENFEPSDITIKETADENIDN